MIVLLLFAEERVTRKYARLSFSMPHQHLQAKAGEEEEEEATIVN